jgi:hypothetical protein
MRIPLPDNGIPVKLGDTSFVYKDVYHPIIWINDEPYRPRVETIVVKYGSMIFLRLKDENDSGTKRKYELPGGSIDEDTSKVKQAENEVNEEALISIRKLYETGFQYYDEYEPGFLLTGQTPLEYKGSISDIYMAEYDGPFDKSKVEEKDLDEKMERDGKFYPIVKVADILHEKHIDALLNSELVDPNIKGSIRLIRDGRKTLADIINEFNKPKEGLFFIEPVGTLTNRMVSRPNGLSNKKSKDLYRIELYNSIENAITGYEKTLYDGDAMYVYSPNDDILDTHLPSDVQSPTASFTGEVWVTRPEYLKVKCVGKIRVNKKRDQVKYNYGPGLILSGALQKWGFTWLVTNVEESNIVLANNTLYHGSMYEIDLFKPMSLDLGNAQQEPGWSTFCFNEYTMANRFGLMRLIQKNIGLMSQFAPDNMKPLLICEWDIENNKPWIHKDAYRYMRTFLLNCVYYVYEIDATNLEVGVGNDEKFKEFTFREANIKPVSIQKLRIDDELLKINLLIIDKPVKEQLAEEKRLINSTNRGWYSRLTNRDYNNDPVSVKLQDAVRDGKLKPGDDINQFMVDNGLSFDEKSTLENSVVCDNTPDVVILEGKYDDVPTSQFGLPKIRKYPLDTEDRVKSAIKFFNYVNKKSEKELASNIIRRVKELGMKNVNIGTSNRFHKYYSKHIAVTEHNILTTDVAIVIDSLTKKEKRIINMQLVEHGKDLVYSDVIDTSSTTSGFLYVYKQHTDDVVGYVIGATVPDTREFHVLNDLIDNLMMWLTGNTVDIDKLIWYISTYDEYTPDVIQKYGFTETESDDDTIKKFICEISKIKNSNDIMESLRIVMEAPDNNDDGDDTSDYTDKVGSGDDDQDEPDDYTDGAMSDDNDVSTDDINTDDTDGDMDPDNNGDDSSDGVEPDADNLGDGSDDDTSDENNDENVKDKDLFENNTVKNYSLLKSFEKLYNLTIEISDSLDSVILPSKLQNSVLSQVIKNLNSIKEFILSFVKFQFSNDNYSFNLYYYNIVMQALKMNLAMLEKGNKLEDPQN